MTQAAIIGTGSSAVFSDDRSHRFRLTRRWDKGDLLAICMLNPSKAGADNNDPTTIRCIGFARSFGFPGLVQINMYSLIATHPRDLVTNLADASNEVTDQHILDVAAACPTVIVAWGANAAKDWAAERAVEVTAMLRFCCPNILCLGYTKDRCPKHPVRLSKTTALEPYNP